MPLKLLFIAPKGKKDSKTNQKPLFHMAIGVLVSLTPDEHAIEIADEHFGDTINYDGDYDLVGITSRTIDATRAYEIADEFRKKEKKLFLEVFTFRSIPMKREAMQTPLFVAKQKTSGLRY